MTLSVSLHERVSAKYLQRLKPRRRLVRVNPEAIMQLDCEEMQGREEGKIGRSIEKGSES